ncbi:formate dehydrogenase accessory sulfurtransferase FdhD [Alicyclobacillus dauci]|uniref:Sulfur carrier protein FdhD n=1 Tax=Alicyclobacillus dauci TaxID=1475485 RepID=A0ABY6Z7S0_9BACL|nr:formate dehydrogenase accessory sulfurtransferase FdhD [Alicyclobacillus dauci]WAH38785.1 formate dehydrogenase accessory sulfurtransferase FdhD [Alicyclobacillus dauci]
MSAWAVRSGSDLPQRAERQILQYRDSTWAEVEDVVASEYALTIYVNDNELATIVCTPTNIEELVVGFMASEGIIQSADQIEDLTVSRFMGTARVKTKHQVTFNQAFYNKRYIASCCGKGRQSFYFHNDAVTAKHVDDDVHLEPNQVFSLLDAMDEEATLFHETGGVHMAALCRPDELLLARTDIGRHNALDKIFGNVLMSGISLAGTVISFSGRISSEVLLKVAKIGVGIVIARSAPTALAIDMADELGITAVGFVRGKSFNVYTHPWRMQR